MTIGIIGYGNMGSCIGERLKPLYEIWAFDKDASKVDCLSGVERADTIKDLVKHVDVIIVAVKPQDFTSVLDEIKGEVGEKLIISIAAGISTGDIEQQVRSARVVRAMPNMPARIGKAMTCLCKGAFAIDDDVRCAKELFDHVGQTLIVNEDMMDAVTAISGSGPGYYYDMIEANNLNIDDRGVVERFNEGFIKDLSTCATNLAFNVTQAMQLAKATTDGSYALLKESHLSPQELKKQIASKGGTTEAALKVLHSGGSLKEATIAARDRARELSKR